MSPVLLVLAGVLGLGFVVLALLRPRVCLVTLVTLDVSNLNAVIAEHVGVSPYRPQLALAVLALVLLACRGRLRLRWSPVMLGLLVLFGGFCLSFVHAADVATSTALLGERSRDLFYVAVVLALLLSTRSTVLVAQASVLVLAGLAGLTVVHEYALGNAGDLYGLSRVPLVQEGGAMTARHAGTSADVNFWARLLILFTPVAYGLLAAARSGRARVLWAGASLALLLGTYLTQSRGGFIAAFVALVCWCLLAGGRWRRALLLMPVALVVLVPLTGIGSRLLTLAASLGGVAGGADMSVMTRKRFQLDAWRMFLDSPTFGHGIGSYGPLFTRYDRLSNSYAPIDIIVAAHNFYLEQAADGGIVLLLGWVVLAGAVLFVALRARSISQGSVADAGTRYLAAGVFAGVLGWAVASVFLHLSDFRALLLVGALAAVLDIEAREHAVPARAPVRPARTGVRALVPVLVPALATTVVLAAAGAVAVVALGPPRWTSAATLAVVPAATIAEGSNAYEIDVISRGNIVPTLTQVLHRSVTLERVEPTPDPRVSELEVAQSRLGGSIVVSVSGSDRATVAAVGQRAVELSRSTVGGLNSSYAVSGAMAAPTVDQPLSAWAAAPALPAALVGLLVGLWRRRRATPSA